jgi:predicted glutamine amidotransferase
MCKIMALTNTTKIQIKDLNEHLKTLRDIVCLHNKDGFGYALSYPDQVFIEKMVDPDLFKGMLTAGHDKLNSIGFNYEPTISDGFYFEDIMPMTIIAHGRTSTNLKGDAEFSHPFYNVERNEALIHNGVIDMPYRPSENKYHKDMLTSNDSEYLALTYWNEGIDGAKELDGYFAFMNLGVNGALTVVKDDFANLYAAYSDDMEGYIIATTEDMIKHYAGKMKVKISAIVEVSENVMMQIRLNTIENAELFVRVDKRFAMSATQRAAFKDYKGSGAYDYGRPSRYTGPSSAGSDVKELKEPTVIKETADTKKNLPIVADSKNDGKSTKKGKGKNATVTITSGPHKRKLYVGMNTAGLSQTEMDELITMEAHDKAANDFAYHRSLLTDNGSVDLTEDEDLIVDELAWAMANGVPVGMV